MAGQSKGAPLFLAMKEEKEQRQKRVMFDESNIIGAKIEKCISMIEKLSTHHKQSKSFKARVYQGKGQSLINPGRSYQYYNINRIRFYDKA